MMTETNRVSAVLCLDTTRTIITGLQYESTIVFMRRSPKFQAAVMCEMVMLINVAVLPS